MIVKFEIPDLSAWLEALPATTWARSSASIDARTASHRRSLAPSVDRGPTKLCGVDRNLCNRCASLCLVGLDPVRHTTRHQGTRPQRFLRDTLPRSKQGSYLLSHPSWK